MEDRIGVETKMGKQSVTDPVYVKVHTLVVAPEVAFPSTIVPNLTRRNRLSPVADEIVIVESVAACSMEPDSIRSDSVPRYDVPSGPRIGHNSSRTRPSSDEGVPLNDVVDGPLQCYTVELVVCKKVSSYRRVG